MTQATMTSLQRVLTTLEHNEPDRVPFFLLLSMHGAKELNLSIKEYFSKAENVVEGQLRLREKYKHDNIYTFFYTGIEIEAMGGSVIFSKNEPPNTGTPIIRDINQIKNLQYISVKNSPDLNKVLQTTEQLKIKVGDDAPIIGVVMSPFSLPVMQLGFSTYIELMFEQAELFNHLMKINEAFCIDWANAQLEAGATAIVYFDPVSSPTIIPKEKFIETGFEIGKRMISKINGPVAIHHASGISIPIADELSEMGAGIIGASTNEDISDLKNTFKNKLTVLGNLNAVEMRRWSPKTTEDKVKEVIQKAGKGGGFVLADNHGEIPWQVPHEVLMAISNAVHKWGKYPLVQ